MNSRIPSPLLLPGAQSGFGVLLDAELRDGLLDAQGGEPRRAVGVPALPHDPAHHPQRLPSREHSHGSGTEPSPPAFRALSAILEDETQLSHTNTRAISQIQTNVPASLVQRQLAPS